MDFNQAVITTQFVINNDSKIVYVYHSDEGWQFFGAEKEINEEDACATSLLNIIISNPHVEEILWLPGGMEAWLIGNNEKKEWQTGIVKEY